VFKYLRNYLYIYYTLNVNFIKKSYIILYIKYINNKLSSYFIYLHKIQKIQKIKFINIILIYYNIYLS